MTDNDFMDLALEEARKAFLEDEVPVGCVIVKDGVVIARAHNTRHKIKNSLNHAEINCINEACNILDSQFLDGCNIYITLEPCIMCAGAIIQSRIKRVIFAAREPKFGAAGSVLNIFNHLEYKFNHEVELIEGIKKEESEQLIKDFFKKLRQKK